MSNFGETLKDLIQENEITPKQLAEAVGVAVSTVHRWQNGKQKIYLSKLLKLADYFHCSLDYLTGRKEDYSEYEGKTCPPFGKRLREVLLAKGITTYRLRKESNIDGCYFYKWDRGSDPHVLTLIELADYLDVSLDYLIGREK